MSSNSSGSGKRMQCSPCSCEESVSSQTTVLASSSHATDVLARLNQLFTDGSMCDYTILAEGQHFRCHRNVLVSVSDYFRVMLMGSMMEAKQDHVELKGLTAHAVGSLLKFIYSGKLSLNLDTVMEILSGACHLQIESAIFICTEYLRREMSVTTAVDILNMSESYSLSKLYTAALKYVTVNFDSIRTEQFLKLSKECLSQIIQCDDLAVSDELTLFQKVVRWIQAQSDFNLSHTSSLMQYVRFALIKPEELVDKISQNSVLQSDSLSKSLLEEAFHYHLLPARQPMLQTPRTQVRNKPCLVALGGRYGLKVGYHNNSCHMYALHGKEWIPLPDAKTKFLFAAVATVDNFMYMCGGMGEPAHARPSCFRFDPRTFTWTKLCDMLTRRQSFPLVAIDKKLYAFGGGTPRDEGCFHPATTKSEVYSIKNDKWSFISDLPQTCKSAAACVYKDTIFISGGRSKETNQRSLWKYTPSEDKYEIKSSLIYALAGHAMVTCGDNIYAIDRASMVVQTYDINNDQWSKIISRPETMLGVGRPTAHGSFVYFISFASGDLDSQCVQYDVTTQTAKNLPDYPEKLHCVMGAVLTLPRQYLVDSNNNQS